MPLRLGGSEIGVVMVHDVTELGDEQIRLSSSPHLATADAADGDQGYLETLSWRARRAGERPAVPRSCSATERLGRLLNDLTDLEHRVGRMGKLAPTRSTRRSTRGGDLSAKAKSGKVTLGSQLPRELPPVLADRDRLVQILINLVDNAIKYTPEGGRVTVRVEEPAQGHIEIDVVDTGIGIPPADLPRITERFYRVDKARSRELGGTGLGLAIVKHLVFAQRALAYRERAGPARPCACGCPARTAPRRGRRSRCRATLRPVGRGLPAESRAPRRDVPTPATLAASRSFSESPTWVDALKVTS